MTIAARHYLILCLVALIAPWIGAYLSSRVNRRVPAILLYYRYFVSSCVFLLSIYTSSLIFGVPYTFIKEAGYAYSMIDNYYAGLLVAMAIVTAATLYGRSMLILASSLLWIYYLALNIILNIELQLRHIGKFSQFFAVHVVDEFIILLVLFGFFISLKQRLSVSGFVQHGR